jgi:Type II/IV secretion system protein
VGGAGPLRPVGAATGLVERVQRRLAQRGEGAGPGALRAAVADALRDEDVLLPAASFAATVRSVSDELTGLGPLGPLLADPAVTDVLVNGPADVWVERDGAIERTPVRFASAGAVAALVQRVVAPLGLRVDEARPWVDARLPGGERFHAVLPPLAPDGPVVTIRSFARRRLSLADLIERGALDAATALLLEAMVAARVAIAVSGATGTGKTTLLNVLERHRLADATYTRCVWALSHAQAAADIVEIAADEGQVGVVWVVWARVAWPISRASSSWVRAPARSPRSASTRPRLLCRVARSGWSEPTVASVILIARSWWVRTPARLPRSVRILPSSLCL